MTILAATRKHISVINLVSAAIGFTNFSCCISNKAVLALTGLLIERKDFVRWTLNNTCINLGIPLKAISADAVITSLIGDLVRLCAVDFLETSIFFLDKSKARHAYTLAPQIILVDSTRVIASPININLISQTSTSVLRQDKIVTRSACTSNA
jgi:hypothetical protein